MSATGFLSLSGATPQVQTTPLAFAREQYRPGRGDALSAMALGLRFWFSVPYTFPLQLEADSRKGKRCTLEELEMSNEPVNPRRAALCPLFLRVGLERAEKAL